MPTINIYYAADQYLEALTDSLDVLKQFVAKELTCSDIDLQPDEISVRLIKIRGTGMLAELELEITAHAFNDRLKRQDQICLNVRQFLKEKLKAADIRVWLLLPNL